MNQHVIAYDLGTSGCKASLYTAAGECRASSTIAYKTFYPQPGYHEQKPEDWWAAVCGATKELLVKTGVQVQSLAALALSGHSLGAVPLDHDGRLLREYTPLWSDRRAASQAEVFFRDIDEEAWYEITGNGFARECYPVFKAMWYRDEEPEMFSRIHRILGTKDFINYCLTGCIATDYSYASGTGIYNLRNRSYDSALIAASSLPESLWPKPGASTHIVGRVTAVAAANSGLPEGLPVISGGVDNSCMALGANNMKDGHAYLSLGSSAWIAVSSMEPVLGKPARSFVFDHVVPNLYTSATSIFAAGSSLNWYVKNLCPDLLAKAEIDGANPYKLAEDMAFNQSSAGAGGVFFNPTLAGGVEGDRRSGMFGSFSGIHLGSGRADLTRAVLEGVAMDLALKYRELDERTRLDPELWIVGGGGSSPRWRQMFADVFNTTLVKGKIDHEAGSLGAAALAAVGVGLWDDFSLIGSINSIESRNEPDADQRDIYRRVLNEFEKLYYS